MEQTYNMKETTVYVRNQNENRKLWESDNTPENVAKYLVAEAVELEEAIQEAMVTGDVFTVASEIGDIGGLLLKLCDLLEMDLETAIRMKLMRNQMKYGDYTMSNGRNYDEASKVSKDAWKSIGGDSAFSPVYLDYLAE